MNDGLIPQRYAMALYKFADGNHNTEAVYDVAKTLVSAFENNPDLNKVLANPFVSREDKQRLLIAAAGDNAPQEYGSFVNLILSHNREMFAYQMALAYRAIYRKINKISNVKISLASDLPKQEIERLDALVKKAYPDRVLEISYDIDPDLIGGFVIDVDNNRMDASISNEIEQLRHNLISSN